MLEWPQTEHGGNDIFLKEESFRIVGLCMEVHRQLGKGHAEVIYKDALEYEFRKNAIAYSREKPFSIRYKEIVLSHPYFADFVVMDKILLEAKAVDRLIDPHVRQTLNYLAASKLKLGLLVNFGEDSLVHRRVAL